MNTIKIFLICIFCLLASFSWGQKTEPFFSEYFEGSGYNKALEIYNPTDRIIDLGEYSIWVDTDGKGFGSGVRVNNLRLWGKLQPQETLLLVRELADLPDLKKEADLLLRSNVLNFNGNDQIQLRRNSGTVVDHIGFPNGNSYGTNKTLIRKPDKGANYGSALASISSEWIIKGLNYTKNLDIHYANIDRIRENSLDPNSNEFISKKTISLNKGLTEDAQAISNECIVLKPGFSTNGFDFIAKIDKHLSMPDDPNSVNAANYTISYSPQSKMKTLPELTKNKEGAVVSYYDGLGNARQTSLVGVTPNHKDLIKSYYYDGLGRTSRNYLPYASNTSDGEYHVNGVKHTENYYSEVLGEDFPYSEVVFEKSPLNEIVEVSAPGETWAIGEGKTTKVKNNIIVGSNYLAWQFSDQNHYYKSCNASLIPSYHRTKLISQEVTDENGNYSTSYKDVLGRVVITSTNSAKGPVETHYIYDKRNRVRFILPPNAIEKIKTLNLTILTSVKDLIYQMVYDKDGNLIHRKQPNKAWEEMTYTKANQLLTYRLESDMKQRFIKYDRLGRVIMRGINNDPTPGPFQEASENASFESSGSFYGYSCNSYPKNQSKLEVLELYYYNDYDFEGANISELEKSNFGQTNARLITGLPTGKREKVHGSKTWLTSTFFYDDKGRLIKTASSNQHDGFDVVAMKLDFAGKIKQKIHEHKRKSTDAITSVLEEYEYDHVGRLTEVFHTINGGAKERLAKHTYNELDQLIGKQVGGKNTSAPLQNVDFDYNIRGWLKGVNNTELSGGDQDLFGFELKYNNPEASGLGTQAQFNGNISEFQWASAKDNKKRTYAYQYDSMNRLTQARFGAGNRFTEELDFYTLDNVAYDANGNITKLKRKGRVGDKAAVIDDLTYTYKTNTDKISHIVDNAPSAYAKEGYCNLSGSGESYSYNKSGFISGRTNQAESYFYYNALDKVNEFEFTDKTGETWGEYTYAGFDKKIKKYIDRNGDVTETEYQNGFIYVNGSLSLIQMSEGYILPSDDGYNYVYQYKDHLGNVHMSYSDLNKDGKVDKDEILEENHYYPYGMQHKGYNNLVKNNNRFKFNGCELENSPGFNFYEMTHRFYFPEIGRWNGIDPVMQPSSSAYSAFNNNPAVFSDPSGLYANYGDDYNEQDDGWDIFPSWGFGLHGDGSGNGIVTGDGFYIHWGDTIWSSLFGIEGYSTQDVDTWDDEYQGDVANEFGDDSMELDQRDDNAQSGGDKYTVRTNNVGWDNLLAEFISGEGPTRSMFFGEHPMTIQMKDAHRVNTGRDAFYKNLANGKDRLTNWNGAFGLAGIVRAGGDMTEQYVGSFRLDVILGKSGNSAVFIVTQSTNMKSAGYRMLDAYPRENNPTPGGNMFQKFVWIEPLR